MTVAIVGVGEVEPAWKHDRPVLGLVVDATRRALADAGLTGADVDGIATEAETMHGGPRRRGRRRHRRPRPAIQRPVVHRRRRRPRRLAARRAGHRRRPRRRRGQLLRDQPQHAGRRPVQRARRGPRQGRPRDAVRVLRPTRLLRRARPALRPRVRPHRRAARRRADRPAGVRPADARRARAGTARPRRLPRRPVRLRPAAPPRLLPDQRLRRPRSSSPASNGPATCASPRSSSPAPGSGPNRSPRPATSRQNPQYLEMASVESGPPRLRSRQAHPGRRRHRRDLRLLHHVGASSSSKTSASPRRARAPSSWPAAPSARAASCRPTPTAGCSRSRTPSGPATSSRRSASCAASAATGQVAGAEVAVVTGLGAMDHATAHPHRRTAEPWPHPHSAPPDYDFTRPFWDGVAAGELRLPRCSACQAWQWYPLPGVEHCPGASLDWTPVGPHGHRLHVHRGPTTVPARRHQGRRPVDDGAGRARRRARCPPRRAARRRRSTRRVGMRVTAVFDHDGDVDDVRFTLVGELICSRALRRWCPARPASRRR